MSARLRSTHTMLMPGVPLYVHALHGKRYSVLIDTGIAARQGHVLELCREAGQEAGKVAFVLLTHAHADHIGNNRAVWQATGAHFAAGGGARWIENQELHYREFCLTDILAEPTQQREEILGLMDGPVSLSLRLEEGMQFVLDDETVLETLRFPGHKLEEVGFLEHSSRTLILGDVLLALATPFFHGFETASGFRASLNKLEGLIHSGQVQQVRAAHHPPLNPEEASHAVRLTRSFLDEVEQATLETASGVDFETLWRRVSATLGREPDFRGYAMLKVQVAELEIAGRLTQHQGQIERR